MRYFHRDIEELIERYVRTDSEEILLLAGARQTGKTTLVENLSWKPQATIINLWDESPETNAVRDARTLEEFERYLKAFYKFEPNAKQVLIIDEAQAATHLARFLMELHRKWRGQKTILLGSILANLFATDAPMPVGRTRELVCRPLNFREFLRFREKESVLNLLPNELPALEALDPNIHAALMSEYELYMQIGGLPGIVQAFNREDDVRLLFDSLIANLYRDADRHISKIDATKRQGRTPHYGSVLEHVLKSIASLVGQPSQNSSLLSTDSPAYRTVLPVVLEALKSWHLGYFLGTETKQTTSKAGYSSKKYLCDTGMVNYFINRLLPVRLVEGNEVSAKLLENTVLQDIASRYHSMRHVASFKTNNRVPNELDFVTEIGDRLVPIEVKSSSKVNQKSLTQLLSFMKLKGTNEGIVVYTGSYRSKTFDGYTVHFVPPYAVSLLF